MESKVVYYPTSKVSESVKNTKAYAESVAEYCMTVLRSQPYNNLDTTNADLSIANGVIPKAYYSYVLKAYAALDDSAVPYPTDVRDLDLITPVREHMISSFVRLSKNFQVYISDPEITMDINYQVREEIKKQLAQVVINTMNEAGMDTNMPSKPEVDIEKLKEQVTDKWKLEKGLDYTKRVKYLEMLIDAEEKYIQAFFYYWATDKVVTYRKVVNNEIIFEVVNPANYLRLKSETSRYIEDDIMGCRIGRISYDELLTHYVDILSPEELEDVEKIFKDQLEKNGSTSGSAFNGVQGFNAHINTITDKGIRSEAKTQSEPKNSVSIEQHHLVYKGFKEIGILTYIDPTGNTSQMEVEPTYEMRKEYGDLELDTKYVPAMYEQLIFQSTTANRVFTKPKQVNPQRESITNVGVIKSPYNGIFGILDDVFINPLPRRMAQWVALYQIYSHKQELAIAKYRENIVVIPEQFLEDSENTTMKTRLNTLRNDSMLIINSENIEQNSQMFNALKSLALTNGAQYIQVLQSLCETVRLAAMAAANMSPQQLGDIGERAGKATTEYAISNSSLPSILMYTMFNKFMERDYSANVDFSKIAWIEGKQGSYVEADGSTSVLNIDGIEHFAANIGIHFINSALEMIKLDRYKALAESFASTGNIESAMISIDGESSLEIKAKIQESIDKEKAYQQSKDNADRQANIDMQEKQIAANQEAMAKSDEVMKYLEEQKYRREELKALVNVISSSVTDEDNLSYQGQINDNIKAQEHSLEQLKLKLQQDKQNADNKTANRKIDADIQMNALKVSAAKSKTK